jgi:hypothetical protein
VRSSLVSRSSGTVEVRRRRLLADPGGPEIFTESSGPVVAGTQHGFDG